MFEKIVLGQTILKFKTPIEILDEINLVYQNKFNQLPDCNYRLVGKIKKEKSIYHTYQGKEHNFLSEKALDFFNNCFRFYVIESKQPTIDIKIITIALYMMEGRRLSYLGFLILLELLDIHLIPYMKILRKNIKFCISV